MLEASTGCLGPEAGTGGRVTLAATEGGRACGEPMGRRGWRLQRCGSGEVRGMVDRHAKRKYREGDGDALCVQRCGRRGEVECVNVAVVMLSLWRLVCLCFQLWVCSLLFGV